MGFSLHHSAPECTNLVWEKDIAEKLEAALRKELDIGVSAPGPAAVPASNTAVVAKAKAAR
jgi:H2-forming N5,N10-methylenetetrahydromethanopterin dehydrogenase-like enzyme